MAASKHAMRSKTLEADDLRSVLSPSGSNRYVPSAFRTRESDIHYTATPSTGKIAARSERVSYEDLIAWAVEVVGRLTEKSVVLSSFIGNFARPLDLTPFPADLKPAFIAIDVASLTESLFEDPAPIRLLRKQGDTFSDLGTGDRNAVLAALSNTFKIWDVRKELRIIDGLTDSHVGDIRVGKTRISLRRLDLPELSDVYVERIDMAGEATAPEPLKRFLDQNNLLTVLFNKIDVVYLNGSLYRDPSLTAGGETLLGYLHVNTNLSTTNSEKGTFSVTHTKFDADSTFGVVVNNLSTPDEVLSCDDLGDEWADFIGINASAQPKTVSFYHAKHGPPSLSASAFHGSVGQAIKNLQHLRLTVDVVDSKRDKWERQYSNDGHHTQIRRIVKGTFTQFRDKALETMSPDTIRRVQIVTDSLSRKEVEKTLKDAKNGIQPPAHSIQLYSLLMGFFSACAEVGAFPAVICRP